MSLCTSSVGRLNAFDHARRGTSLRVTRSGGAPLARARGSSGRGALRTASTSGDRAGRRVTRRDRSAPPRSFVCERHSAPAVVPHPSSHGRFGPGGADSRGTPDPSSVHTPRPRYGDTGRRRRVGTRTSCSQRSGAACASGRVRMRHPPGGCGQSPGVRRWPRTHGG